jgi:hypothetical protein
VKDEATSDLVPNDANLRHKSDLCPDYVDSRFDHVETFLMSDFACGDHTDPLSNSTHC